MNPSRFLRFVPALGLIAFALAASPAARADDVVAAPRVRVHLSSPTPVQLQRRDSERGTWDLACDAPCDRELPLEGEYRILYGKAGATGDVFRLAGTPGADLTVTAHPPSEAEKSGGDALIGVGAVLGVASVVSIVYFGALAAKQPSGEACSDGQATDGRDGGIACGLGQAVAAAAAVLSGVVLLGAVGMVAGGFALRADSGGSTTQKVRPDARDVAVREPTWTAPHALSTGKPAFVLPLSFSF